ncbi:MAG: hypothetical protein FWE80_07190, partial [Oscillospiraceae bacterium]|nr:hypothetical protein [Oscillospiraceae bacterium]
QLTNTYTINMFSSLRTGEHIFVLRFNTMLENQLLQWLEPVGFRTQSESANRRSRQEPQFLLMSPDSNTF